MAREIFYQEIWENKLAQRLDKPTNWKETCDVIYTDSNTLVLPYIGTAGEPAVSATYLTSTGDRTDITKVVTLIDFTQTSETLAISTTNYDAVYVDYAAQAQSNYAKLAATTFTVSASNVDDAVRGIIEQIYTANGFDLYKQRGGFIVWRPADWTFMVQFMQANGFNLADVSLKNGGSIGIDYLGIYHYVSTSHATNHLMAGVRGLEKLGLLRSTYGKTYVTETPSSSTAGFLSGTAIHTRLDYGLKVQTNVKPCIFDVNVV